MEACPWGQARAGRRRGSARKVAGGQGKVASGQGKVAGFVSICMFCVFHIGLNGIKSRGGWPTWPWQPVAAPAVASGPATERVTEELHQKDYVKSYHWTQQKHTPCTYILFCFLHIVAGGGCSQMVNYPRHVIVQSCYIQDLNRVTMTIELDRQDAMGSSNMTHVHKESLCFCVCLCSVGFVFICICTFCVFHIGLNGTKSRGGWPTRPWQPVAAPAVASVTSERSPLAVLTSAFVKLMRFDF